MLRRLSVILLAGLALFLGSVGPASAAPATNTTTEKGLVETFVDVVNACDPGGEPYLITTTSNVIEHETVFDDGRAHFKWDKQMASLLELVADNLADRPAAAAVGR